MDHDGPSTCLRRQVLNTISSRGLPQAPPSWKMSRFETVKLTYKRPIFIEHKGYIAVVVKNITFCCSFSCCQRPIPSKKTRSIADWAPGVLRPFSRLVAQGLLRGACATHVYLLRPVANLVVKACQLMLDGTVAAGNFLGDLFGVTAQALSGWNQPKTTLEPT